MWHIIYSLFIPLSLSSLCQSHLSHPNPLLSLSPQSSLLFHAHANVDVDNHFHIDADADLSLVMVFLFFFSFFFGCGLIGSVPTEVGGFEWARLWVGDVSVGVMLVWFNDDDDGNEDGGFGV